MGAEAWSPHIARKIEASLLKAREQEVEEPLNSLHYNCSVALEEARRRIGDEIFRAEFIDLTLELLHCYYLSQPKRVHPDTQIEREKLMHMESDQLFHRFETVVSMVFTGFTDISFLYTTLSTRRSQLQYPMRGDAFLRDVAVPRIERLCERLISPQETSEGL